MRRSAIAQTTPATGADSATPATPAAGEVKQIALTPALIEQFVAAKKEIDTVLEKMPDGTDEPDPGTMSKLDAVAKKYKFAGYKDYDAVENNIGIVMAGIDPDAKRYIGVDAVIKKQVADIQADKQISAKDKKDTIDQLNATLPTDPEAAVSRKRGRRGQELRPAERGHAAGLDGYQTDGGAAARPFVITGSPAGSVRGRRRADGPGQGAAGRKLVRNRIRSGSRRRCGVACRGQG